MEKIDPSWGDADELSSVRHQCRDRSVGGSLNIHPSTQAAVDEQCKFKDSLASSIRKLRDVAQLLPGDSSVGQAQLSLGCIESIHLTESQLQAKCQVDAPKGNLVRQGAPSSSQKGWRSRGMSHEPEDLYHLPHAAGSFHVQRDRLAVRQTNLNGDARVPLIISL